MEYVIIIPARYASSRLPGKPLALVGGLPMIQRVYQQARLSQAREVVIATDDLRVAELARGFGAEVVMTAAEHASGTDRLEEVVCIRNYPPEQIVVNLQGDEPLIPPELLDQVATALAESSAPMATLCEPIRHRDDFFNPNIVKVVRNAARIALYFSRAPIPFARDIALDSDAAWQQAALPALRHIGLYAYRAGLLHQFVGWPVSPLEQIEALEQLRALSQGVDILVEEARVTPPPGVDTPADLELINQLWIERAK